MQVIVSRCSDLNSENSDHENDCAAVILDGDETVGAYVPMRGDCRLESGAVVLLDDARYNILGGFV